MTRHRQLVVGLVLLIAGLTVIAIGTIFPSTSYVVAVGWLLLFPLLVSFAGAIFVFVGLARRSETAERRHAAYRIIGLPGVAGLGLALGYGAAGCASQIPDSLAGLNGPFVPGPGVGLSAFLLGGVGLSVGLLVGIAAALVWWSVRARRSAHA